jgi:hypothetical protein
VITIKKNTASDCNQSEFWLLFEHAVNRSIPVLVILLLLVIMLDNPLWEIYDLDRYETSMIIFSTAVFFFFIFDLFFKWQRIKKLGRFIRLYWIDILAVFPFYLCFRAYSGIAYFFLESGDITKAAQELVHESIILKEMDILKGLKETKPILKIIKVTQGMIKIWSNRLLLTHHHLKELSRHKKQVNE